MFAKRMSGLQISGIRKVFELARTMKNPIDFSIGQPDFDVPNEVKNVAIEAIKAGKNRYTVTAGVEELKSAIKDDLSTREGIKVDSVISTAGGSGALMLALFSLVDEEHEVLVADPGFLTYGHLIRLAGAKVKYIDTYPDFKITPERLKASVTPKTKVMIFNSPANPTGIAYTGEELKALAECSKKLGLFVISDEVYDTFSYDFKHESWLKYDTGALLVRAFSKSVGMTGWRSGYAAGPRDLIDQMTMLQQFTFVCVHAPTQWASIQALKTDMSEAQELFKKKRDMLYEGLKDYFNVIKPQGAFYMFPEAPNKDAEKFVNKCIEHELLVIPGSAFSAQNTNFRISYATDMDSLKRGIDLLQKLSKQ